MNISNNALVGGLVGFLGGAIIFVALLALAVLIVQLIATIKVYIKAGKGGWEAIIPYYNSWILCEITGVKWYFFLGLLATNIVIFLGLKFLLFLAWLVNLAASFAVHYNLARKFGKDPIGFGIGLTLLPVVFYSILGFGSDTYKDVKVSSYGPVSEETIEKTFNKTETNNSSTKKSTTKSKKFCKSCGSEISDGKYCPNCGSEIH